jgi:type II secretory ATPase GspE/PulE/Tfp pilus assembly ATPase PilB-like protein
MGVEPFLIGSSVRAFLAQRLVRRLCPDCKKPDAHAADYLEQIGFPREWAGSTYGPNGCDSCRGTGYRGRTALYEICMVTPALQDLIQMKAVPSVLRAKAVEEGLISLRSYGWKRVMEGVTSVAEVLRVTAADVKALDE